MAKNDKPTKAAEETTNVAEGKAADVVEEKTNEEKRVPYYIPYIPGEEREVTVGINGKMYKIQKGVRVMVPEVVAEVLMLSDQQTVELERIKEEVKEQDLSY